MQHAELHVHDMFSLLDGASSPAEYMQRANDIGITHLAETNHGTNMGHREFLRQAQSAGITPILGQEAYITHDRFDRRGKAQRQDGTSIYNHITLLALNEKGLESLETLSRIGWTEGYYYKPRIDLEVLEEHSEGIIALSGCMSGMIAKAIEAEEREQAEDLAKNFKRIFGDRFYMEVMESNSKSLNQKLVKLGQKFDIEPVITSDCHMASPEDLWLAEAMLILNTNPKAAAEIERNKFNQMEFVEKMNYMYPGRVMTFQEFELFLHSYDQHKANLEKHGLPESALTNTMVIAEQVEEYPYYEHLDTLPVLYENGQEELERRTYAGLIDRGLGDNPEAQERVRGELDTIAALGLANYFLIEEDICDFADRENILRGYGRGSAVSYLTNYALGITKINPLPYNLLPERFLSAEREDPADIDTDFAIDGRYRVKKYAEQKYHHVSNIATITYYKDKSAIKAAAKVLGMPYAVSLKLGNMVDTIRDFESLPDLADLRKQYPDLPKLAKALVDRPASIGMHAGGTIISKEPIERHVPVQSATDPSDESSGRVSVAALDMRELADIGFVKYDFLGLRTLSIVDDALKMIKERHNIDIDIEQIPLDDSNIYDMISEGHTALLFQAEQQASTLAILNMGGVSNFNELVASNALVRPGAANSSVGSTYIRGKRTGATNYIHPDTEWFTEETWGAILYQEQQLLLCEHIAGMTKVNANKVRKAVSKKIPEDLAVWKDEFVTGATEKLGRAKAERVWKDLEASADYAFAKAHAVGYSMLTLLTAYLKYYYPIEYITAAIGRLKSSAKNDRMKMLMYLIEAKRLGIRVKLPHVNSSDIYMSIQTDAEGDYIRFGMSNIKGIGPKTAKKIIEKGPYESYEHLVKVAEEKYSGIGSNVLEAMNKVGAAAFDDNPRLGNEKDNYYTYLNIPEISYDLPPNIKTQFRPLVSYEDGEAFVIMAMAQDITRKNGWQRVDFIDETGSAGIFTAPHANIETGKIYVALVSNASVVDYCLVEDLDSHILGKYLYSGEMPELGDMTKVVAFFTRTTKAGKKMAEVVVADEFKNLTGAKVWPSQFAQAHTICKPGAVVDLEFKELDDGTLAVDRIL